MGPKLFALLGILALLASIIYKIVQTWRVLFPSGGIPLGVI